MAAAELEELLAELLEPDSAALRRATARLREAFADPRTPARLGLLLRAAPRPQVRQMAAVLLRRRLLGRWRRLDPALRLSLPALLADALEEETERPVTLALAQLAAALLRRAGPEAWGPLGVWVQGAARDPRPPRQEAALLVLSAALEAAPQALAPHGPALAALCRGALAPEAPPGPTALALRALGALAATVGDTQTELLRSLLPDVLAALRKLVDADEERAAEALEVLDEFLEADPASVTSDLRPLLDLCLQVGGAEGRGDVLRARALAVVAFLGQKRPKALLRGGLLPLALGGLLAPLCAPPRPGRPDPEDQEEEGGEGLPPRGAPCPRHAAAQALEALAGALPPDRILQPLVPLLAQALGSPQAGARKGALLALAALGEPCGETLRRRYQGAVLGALRGGLGDPDSAVRGAAAFALRSLADCLQPEAAAVAAEAMPGALGALGGGGGPSPPQSKAWFVLEALVETLGEAVGPWVPPVLEAALGALGPGAPPPQTELGLSALHTLATAAGEGLRPHAAAILGALTPLLRPGPPERRPLRLQALEVVGALGAAAGEGLGAALELGVPLALEEDEPQGRRVLFALAGAGSRALGAGLEPLLPLLLPVLQGALLRPPPAVPTEPPDSFLLFDDVSDDEEGAEPMGDDVSDDESIEVEVGGAWAEEVEEACEALGELAQHTGAAFLPYADSSLEAVMSLLRFPHPALRRAAYGALGCLCRPLGGAPAPPPAQGPSPALSRAVGALVEGARGEGRAGGAGAALGALGRLLLDPPQPLPPPLLPPVGRLLCDVIKGEIACLKGGGDDVSDDDEEETEAGAELRELAGEGLAALGGAMGGAAAPFFLEALEPLLGALGAGREVGRRSWAAATLGEVGGALGEAVAGPALPLIGRALGEAATRDPHPEVRSNAFYALGRLAQAAGHALRRVAWPGAAVLTRALGEGGEGPGRARDNACAALVRHQGALPPETVVPLVLRALPLRHDPEEEEPVLRYLQGALRRRPALLQEHAAELPRACACAVGSGRLPPELEAALVQLLREVWGSCPTAFGEGLARLPHGEAARLRQALGLPDAPGSPCIAVTSSP